MSDARRRAEEALAAYDVCYTTMREQPSWTPCLGDNCAEALRALLAEGPEAAVLPLEAPECNDGDDCCRYCGRGLQPCGACKPAPPADPQTVLDTIRWVLNDAHYKAPEQIAGCWHSVWAPKLREALDAMPVGCTTPPADAATEAVREAAERLLEDYEGVEDMLLPDTAGKVLRLRTALAARRGDV